jgi:hypothetical protein
LKCKLFLREDGRVRRRTPIKEHLSTCDQKIASAASSHTGIAKAAEATLAFREFRFVEFQLSHPGSEIQGA